MNKNVFNIEQMNESYRQNYMQDGGCRSCGSAGQSNIVGLSPATCPPYIDEGDRSVTISVDTPGTPPYTFRLFEDDMINPVQEYVGTIGETSHIFTHNFVLGAHNYMVQVVDSCLSGSLSASDSCPYSVTVVRPRASPCPPYVNIDAVLVCIYANNINSIYKI